MQRLSNKPVRRIAVALVIAIVPAAMAMAGEIKAGTPAVPAVAATTPADAAAPKPPVVKKKYATKSRGVSSTQTVIVELPRGDDVYPDKPGAVVVDRNCLSCHSPEIVANQPAFSRAQWLGVITKMRSAYNASIPNGDIPVILDYLISLRGEARLKWR